MLKVALIKPYQPAVCNGMSPPLGILYLAASLRQQLGSACPSRRSTPGSTA
jgi:hypothetical protein